MILEWEQTPGGVWIRRDGVEVGRAAAAMTAGGGSRLSVDAGTWHFRVSGRDLVGSAEGGAVRFWGYRPRRRVPGLRASVGQVVLTAECDGVGYDVVGAPGGVVAVKVGEVVVATATTRRSGLPGRRVRRLLLDVDPTMPPAHRLFLIWALGPSAA